VIRRREFLVGGAGLAAGALAGCGVGPQSAPKPVAQPVTRPEIDGDLLIFNWTEYMNPKVIKRFEKHYGVDVTVSNFDSMPGMMAKLRAGNRYDLIFPTADYVNRLVRVNGLRPLDRAVLKNSGGIYPFFDDPWYDKDSAHTVPYGMYTTGIAWRSDKVGELTGSWNDLTTEAAKGQIFMLDDHQEAIGQANLLNGFELNTTAPDELEQSKETLEHQKEYLRGYSTNPRAQPRERQRLDPPRLERRRRERAQPVQGAREPALPDLQRGHPGGLGLHGDPIQRAPPRDRDALAMSDRIAIMHDGVVEQLGAPEEIYEHPVKPFVAGLIGISNLLPGTVENGGVRLSGGALVPAAVPDGIAPGSDVQLSVRPEKVWIDELEPGMAELAGTVAEPVYLGTTTQFIVDVGPQARLVALEQNTARARADDRWELGDGVRVGWRPEHGQVLR
jgi:hypothetical protein